ncbi:MAG: CarD family transcriptional regulator [Hyphomicrobiaceae bacterium]|nr:CarD family transcriptional regulator [Hyphomicrobiaceae bacterium]
MAQKKKSQSKVKPASTAAKAVKKPAAKVTKPAAPKKAAKPAKASASKPSVSAKKPVAAAKPVKPARPVAKPAPAAKADVKPAAPKAKVAAAPAPAPKVAPRAAAQHAPAKHEVKADAPRKAVVPAAAASAGKSQPQRAVPASVTTPAKERITAPVGAPRAPEKAEAKPAAPAKSAEKVDKKPVGQRHGFKMNEHIVYPAHGVGRIVGIEEQEIAGMSLELFVITFEKEKLTLRVPTGKLESVGMRKLAEENIVSKAMETLKGRARVKRTMWSRRAQEYVAKINSGDLVSIAEVVRDLYRSEAQPEQSYSERQLYEDALDRMAREIAAVEKLDDRGAVQRITDVLAKSAKGRRATAEDAEAEAA